MENISEKLFQTNKKDYGQKYEDHLFDQYKIYIESVEKISDRRQKNNEFFVALNTALLGILGYINIKTKISLVPIVVFFSIAGIIINYYWYRTVRSFKGLNSGKFKLIHEIESRLPIALFKIEWDVLGRGKKRDLYWPVSHIETKIPWLFMFLYFCILFWIYQDNITTFIYKVFK